jgi:hypothetical protein
MQAGTGAMATARFQILTVNGNSPPRVTWRFLSANNRRLGRSTEAFADVDTCRAAVRELRHKVGDLAVVMLRDGPRGWVWRVQLAEVDLAMSTRSYERWVEAENACASFLDQVAQVPHGQQPQLVQF